MIPSAVFVQAVELQTKVSLSSIFLRNLRSVPKTSTHVLSNSRKHTTGFFVKSVAGVRCWWLPVTARQVTASLTRSVSVSGELNHDRSSVVLDSCKVVCCHILFYILHQCWEPICYPGPHKLWIIAVRPKITINFILKFYLYLHTRDRGFLWHTTLSTC